MLHCVSYDKQVLSNFNEIWILQRRNWQEIFDSGLINKHSVLADSILEQLTLTKWLSKKKEHFVGANINSSIHDYYKCAWFEFPICGFKLKWN